eukprot:3684248-Prymnesium_polylepis.2
MDDERFATSAHLTAVGEVGDLQRESPVDRARRAGQVVAGVGRELRVQRVDVSQLDLGELPHRAPQAARVHRDAFLPVEGWWAHRHGERQPPRAACAELSCAWPAECMKLSCFAPCARCVLSPACRDARRCKAPRRGSGDEQRQQRPERAHPPWAGLTHEVCAWAG